jgi:uncharacterized protein YbjT (DUF2867 family)
MKIVVIGGTGLIGSKTIKILQERGHQAVAASPNSGVNTVTGEGLAEVLAGADVVIDVANSPSFADADVLAFFTASGNNLLKAEAEAGVKHHIALSVVGTDLLAESGYFRGKIAQEKLIREGKVPYTIVHSTQFFEFLGGIAQSGADGDTVRLSPALVQPISSDDVALAMADYATSAPVNGTVEIAGPEAFPLSALVQRYLASIGDPRKVEADAGARYFGALLNERTLVPADAGKARLGSATVQSWLQKK